MIFNNILEGKLIRKMVIIRALNDEINIGGFEIE